MQNIHAEVIKMKLFSNRLRDRAKDFIFLSLEKSSPYGLKLRKNY